MATTAEPASAEALPDRSAPQGHALRFVLAMLTAAAAIGAAVIGRRGGAGSQLGWLMLVLVWLTGAVAITMSRARARRGAERARTLTVALATALAAEVVIVASALHLLVGWPPRLLQITAAATVAVARRP